MKILWFSLSPCGSIRRTNMKKYNQGWMISLEDQVKKYAEIDLYVAYYDNRETNNFEFDGVHYYPIKRLFCSNPIQSRLRKFLSQKILDRKAIPSFLKVIEQVHPDLIHIHGTEEAFGRILEYVDNIPIVFSIQGLLAPYACKFFSGLPKDQLQKYESFTDKFMRNSYLHDYNVNCYRKNREIGYLEKAKYIFGRTFWDEQITLALNRNRTYYKVNEILRFPFFHGGWDKAEFGRKITIVSTVSIGIYKGYETLLRAADILKKHSKINFEWQIIGYDRNHKCAKITHKMTKLNPDECNIKFLGLKTAEEMVTILQNADIYCHVSHIENSPNSVCEAMLLGIPIIASFAGGTASLLKNGKEGMLVQDGDPFILAGALCYYIEHFELAKEFGKNARKRALIRHNPGNVVKELINAYNDILNNEI